MKTIPMWLTDDVTRLRLGVIKKLLQEELVRHSVLKNKKSRTLEDGEEMREINLRINALERIWNYAIPIQPGLPDTRKRFSDSERKILEEQFSALVRNGDLRNEIKNRPSQANDDTEKKKIQETITQLEKNYNDLQRLTSK